MGLFRMNTARRSTDQVAERLDSRIKWMCETHMPTLYGDDALDFLTVRVESEPSCIR